MSELIEFLDKLDDLMDAYSGSEFSYIVLAPWAVKMSRHYSGLHERGWRHQYATPKRGALRRMERRLVASGALR